MMRISGFLLGTVLVLTLFVLALNAGNSQPVPVATSTKAATPTLATESVAPVDLPIESTAGKLSTPAADTSSHDEEPRFDVKDSELEPDRSSSIESLADYATADRNQASQLSRYRIWNPFRSEWAARGFSQQLALATEVPVEVVNNGPETYQVIFRYRDDAERQALIKQIEAVTGLVLE